MLLINIKENVSAYAVSEMLSDLNMALRRNDKVHVLPAWAEAVQVTPNTNYTLNYEEVANCKEWTINGRGMDKLNYCPNRGADMGGEE